MVLAAVAEDYAVTPMGPAVSLDPPLSVYIYVSHMRKEEASLSGGIKFLFYGKPN